MNEESFFGCITLVVLLFTCLLFTIGIPVQVTRDGTQYGYVVSVDQRSIPNTGVVYYKSETESSESNSLCTSDSELLSLAREYGESGQRVKFDYDGVIIGGLANCTWTLTDIQPQNKTPD